MRHYVPRNNGILYIYAPRSSKLREGGSAKKGSKYGYLVGTRDV